MKTILVIVLFSLASTFHAQTPGMDSLFLQKRISSYSSTNMTTGQTRGSSNVFYLYKLGATSGYVQVKGKNYKRIVDVFPESSKKYRQCRAKARQATLLGATAIALTGTFIAGVIVGGKNIGSGVGFIGLGGAAVSLGGIFILPKLAHKKANKALQYFEESADVYNAQLKK